MGVRQEINCWNSCIKEAIVKPIVKPRSRSNHHWPAGGDRRSKITEWEDGYPDCSSGNGCCLRLRISSWNDRDRLSRHELLGFGTLLSAVTLLCFWLTMTAFALMCREIQQATGTSFRNANPTNAQFDGTLLRNTDFRGAIGMGRRD